MLAGAPISTPVPVRNRPPGASMVPADEMVGTDFLALVRFGLRAADDPRILSTLAVTDAPAAHRDAERTGLAPLQRRRLWRARGRQRVRRHRDRPGLAAPRRRARPLRAGGRPGRPPVPRDDAAAWRRGAGCFPSRSGTRTPIPAAASFAGRPSGSAMPLAWAHAEYVKLAALDRARSRDRPPRRGVAPLPRRGARLRRGPRGASPRRARPWRRGVSSGSSCWPRPGCGARSMRGGRGPTSTPVTPASACGSRTCPGSELLPPGRAVEFTPWWPQASRWEGRNLRVSVVDAPGAASAS